LDHRVFNQETESNEEEKAQFSKIFVENADAEAPNFLLLLERGSIIFFFNEALNFFGVDPKQFI
jgi:hypothetical protein